MMLSEVLQEKNEVREGLIEWEEEEPVIHLNQGRCISQLALRLISRESLTTQVRVWQITSY